MSRRWSPARNSVNNTENIHAKTTTPSPHDRVNRTLVVLATLKRVRILDDNELIASHGRRRAAPLHEHGDPAPFVRFATEPFGIPQHVTRCARRSAHPTSTLAAPLAGAANSPTWYNPLPAQPECSCGRAPALSRHHANRGGGWVTKTRLDDNRNRNLFEMFESPAEKLMNRLGNSPAAQIARTLERNDVNHFLTSVQQASIAFEAYAKSPQWAEFSTSIEAAHRTLERSEIFSALSSIDQNLRNLALSANRTFLPAARP